MRGIERALARVAERRVAEIVRQRQRLGQILVQRATGGQSARAIWATSSVWVRRVRIMVALVEDEHLRLVGQAAERGGVHDAVAVALERRAHRAGGLSDQPTARGVGIGSV